LRKELAGQRDHVACSESAPAKLAVDGLGQDGKRARIARTRGISEG